VSKRVASAGAIFDITGTHRYLLWRDWDNSLPTVAFVMLNPSTADAERMDPNIRRCLGFARSWGYGRMIIGNLYAYRATDPRVLTRADDPVGPDNERYLRLACCAASLGHRRLGQPRQLPSSGHATRGDGRHGYVLPWANPARLPAPPPLSQVPDPTKPASMRGVSRGVCVDSLAIMLSRPPIAPIRGQE